MITGLKNNHPQITKRPASSGQQPLEAPRDEVILGSARPELGTLSFGAKAFALGAMSLSAFGCATSATPPVQLTQTQPEPRPVHRHSNPIAGEQSTRLQELGEARESDSPEARQVRNNYRANVTRLLKDADKYMDLSETLESEGRRLEGLGLTTETKDGVTTTVARDGENWTVTVDNGRRQQILEDTPTFRRVTDGINVTTLHLTDSILHRAGDFESQQFTRSWQDSLTVNGTRITRNLERMTFDENGRSRTSTNEVFEQPENLSLDGSGPQLVYRENSTKRNMATQEVTTSAREVEVNADGTTRSK